MVGLEGKAGLLYCEMNLELMQHYVRALWRRKENDQMEIIFLKPLFLERSDRYIQKKEG